MVRKTLLRLDRLLGGIPGILVLAVRRFSEKRGSEAAASIAYYAIFSLFPLLLFLSSVVGYILVEAPDPAAVVELLSQFIPISRTFLLNTIQSILEQRTTTGLVGLIGLAWSASGVFLTLARNINRAWPDARPRGVIEGRLLALTMVASLLLLLIVTLALTAARNLLPFLNLPESTSGSTIWQIATNFLPWIVAFFVFFTMYILVPNTTVRWTEAFWGALVATAAWEIGTMLLTWYIRSGLVNLDLIYGSLGTMIALLIWIYFSAVVIVFGAYLSSAVALKRRLKKREGIGDHDPSP